MRALSLLLALLQLTSLCVSAQGTPGFTPLDAEQIKLVNTATDELIEKIKALKGKFPGLEKFGEAPYFTRGEGEFRYDYKTKEVAGEEGPKAQALPGGCGIYFRAIPMGAPDTKWSKYYYWASSSSLGGVAYELSVTAYHESDEGTRSPLYQAILAIEMEESDTTFARLNSEYYLKKNGVALDTASIIAAADDSDPVIAWNAFTALRFRELSPEQLAQFRQGFKDGKYMFDANSARSIIDVIKVKDPGQLPIFLNDLVVASLKKEQAGMDTFHQKPLTFNEPWTSEGGTARLYVVDQLKDGDPRFLPVAALILSSDTLLRNREKALEYIVRQPGAEARKLFVASLGNSDRTIQSEIADAVGEKKITAGETGLRALLVSPSPRVRAAAVEALKNIGVTVPAPAAPSLSDSARAIAAVLWKRGLNDDDFLKSHQLMGINEPLMKTFDRESVAKEAAPYAEPKDPKKSSYPAPWDIQLPPQFLLAAAVKFKDDATAVRVYGYLCDYYETDDDILVAAYDKLGWDRFAEGLDQFHTKRDGEAMASLASVIALADLARPYSLLNTYVQQSQELIGYLKSKPPEDTSPEPDKANTAAYLKYWIARLKDSDGTNPSPAGENIRQVGLPALPFLIDSLGDKTLTRNFSYGRSYAPMRNFIYVGDACKNIIGVIARDYDLKLPGLLQQQYPRVVTKDLQDKLRAWAKAIPPDQKLVPPNKRDRPLLAPAGPYYGGDD